MDIYSWILTLAIISGQIIKIPITPQGGVSMLDPVVVIFCIKGLLKLKFKLKKPPAYIIGASAFISVAILSLIFTPLHLTQQSYLNSFLYTIRFMSLILLGWLIFSGAFDSLRKNAIFILIISGVGLAILGLLQLIFLPDLRFLTKEGWDPHYFRTVSTFLDPNFLGAFLALTILLLVNHLRTHKLFYLIFGITYIGLLTTFSRSSYLMFLAIGLTFSLFKKSKTFLILTILLCGGLMLGFQVYSKTVAEPRNINRQQSASSRLNTWQQGLSIFQKAPIIGVGFNAYRYGLEEYNLGDDAFLESHGSSSNDSSLLFVASTTGILGLISYLYFLWTLNEPLPAASSGVSRKRDKFLSNHSSPQQSCEVFWFNNKSTKEKIILTSALTGLIIHSFFANSLFYPPILAWIVLFTESPKN